VPRGCVRAGRVCIVDGGRGGTPEHTSRGGKGQGELRGKGKRERPFLSWQVCNRCATDSTSSARLCAQTELPLQAHASRCQQSCMAAQKRRACVMMASVGISIRCTAPPVLAMKNQSGVFSYVRIAHLLITNLPIVNLQVSCPPSHTCKSRCCLVVHNLFLIPRGRPCRNERVQEDFLRVRAGSVDDVSLGHRT